MVDAFRKTVRHEGFGALYKGLVPNSVKVTSYFEFVNQDCWLLNILFSCDYFYPLSYVDLFFLYHGVLFHVGGSINSNCICDI